MSKQTREEKREQERRMIAEMDAVMFVILQFKRWQILQNGRDRYALKLKNYPFRI